MIKIENFKHAKKRTFLSMKRKTMIILFILALMIAACTATGKVVSEDSIKIGGVFHLSSPGAFWGEGEMNAALMAVDEINSNGGIDGKRMELMIEDSQTDFTTTNTVVRRMIDIEKVEAIIGPTWFGQTIAPIAKEKEFVIVSPSAGVVNEPSEYFFTLWPTEEQEAEAMTEYFVKENVDELVIVYTLNDWSESVKDEFVKKANSLGIDVVKEFSTVPGEKDFRTTILKIQELDVDALYAIFAFYPDQGNFMKQANNLGLDAQVYSISGTENQVLLESFPEIEGTIYPYPLKSEVEQLFIEMYIAEYSQYPSPSSAYAYDAVMILAEALEQGKNPEEISEYLHSMTYEGYSNNIEFDSEGRITDKEFVIKRVIDGKFE